MQELSGITCIQKVTQQKFFAHKGELFQLDGDAPHVIFKCKN